MVMADLGKNISEREERRELNFEELEGVAGGTMSMFQKAGVFAAVRLAKLSGYTLDDMEYIFDAARRAAAKGDLRDVTPEELEAYIRSVWDII